MQKEEQLDRAAKEEVRKRLIRQERSKLDLQARFEALAKKYPPKAKR